MSSGPTLPPPPATRTLSVVLREALAASDDVQLIVGKALADGSLSNPNAYMNVEIGGIAVTVPKLAGAGLGGSAVGYAVYLLATKDFMLAVGTVIGGSGGGAIGGVIPIGGIFQWPTASPPANHLMCDGSGFSSVTYPQLASVLGSTTLPNYCRRVPVGRGSGGSGGYEVGANEGLGEGSRGPYHHHRLNAGTDSQGSHQHPAAGSHNHFLDAGLFAVSFGGQANLGSAGSLRNLVGDTASNTNTVGDHTHGAAGGHTHNVNADTSGGNGSDAPAFIVVNFVIRAL